MKTTLFVSSDARSGFQCGKAELDFFFKQLARSHGSKGLNKTYVLRRSEQDPEDWPVVLGFYSLTVASIPASALPTGANPGVPPHYPTPVALIARLAVDARVKGKGLAGDLLTDAENRVLYLAEQIGIVDIVVDAKDDEALGFYEHQGYELLPQQLSWPKRMFVTLKDLRATGA